MDNPDRPARMCEWEALLWKRRSDVHPPRDLRDEIIPIRPAGRSR